MNFNYSLNRIERLTKFVGENSKHLDELGVITMNLENWNEPFNLKNPIKDKEVLFTSKDGDSTFIDDAAYYLTLSHHLFLSGQKPEYIKAFLEKAKKWKWEKRDSWSAFVLIAKNKIQGLSIMTLIQKGLENDFWKEYRAICYTLPYLEVKETEFLELSESIIEKTKDNGAQGDFFNSITKLAEFQPELGKAVTDKALTGGNDGLRSIYSNLIAGLTRTSKRKEILNGLLEGLKNGSERDLEELIDSVLKIDFGNDQLFLEKIENELNNGLKGMRFLKARYMITYFYLKWYTEFKGSRKNLIWLSKNGSDEVLYALVNGTSRDNVYEKDKGFISAIVDGLLRIKGSHQGTLERLSFLFSDLLNNDQQDSVFKFLSQWHKSLDVQFDDYKTLKFFFQSHHIKLPELLNRLFTYWFASEDILDHNAAFHLLIQLGSHSDYFYSVDETRFDLLNMQQRRRFVELLGAYVYNKDHLRAGLISILALKPYDEKTAEVAGWGYVNFLSYNYPSTIEFLEQQLDKVDRDVKKQYKKIIEISNTYYKSINELPVLNEFKPSDSRMRTYEKMRQKKFREEYNDHESKSDSFLSSLPTVQLKAKKWFHKNENGYTTPQSLGKFESSFEMPRAEEIDPIGQEKQRRILRAKKISQ